MKTVNIGDVELNVTEGGRGTPLLLVHAFPLDHTMWRHQIEEFSTNCHVIAPDLRGFGKSSVTEGTVTMQQYADDLAKLLDALEVTEPVVLCGASMGGYIAWQFYERYQDRVAAMVVCDTRAVADTEEGRENRLKMAERVVAEGAQVAAEAMLPKFFAAETYRKHGDLVESVRQTILNTSPQGIAAAQRGMAERPDVTGILREIDAPVLVVCGEEDTISPPDEMRMIENEIPDSAWFLVPNAGHLSPLENPEAFNRAMTDFLT